MNTANWLQDFVKWVITLRAGMNTFVLTHKGRERLIVALEQCVCHKPLLKRYLAVLQVALNGISRPSPLLTPEQAGRLASERVAVLTPVTSSVSRSTPFRCGRSTTRSTRNYRSGGPIG